MNLAGQHKLRTVLHVLILIAAIAGHAFGRWINRLYDAEPLWIVAEYAEPWRSVALALVISGMALLCWRGRPISRASTITSAARLFVGLLACAELSMGLYFEVVSGRLGVAYLSIPRAEADFRATADGYCAQRDLTGVFTWTVDGKPFRPRLLPLPLDLAKLQEELNRSHPENCAAR